MSTHRTYYDPPRTSAVRHVERIAPMKGHRIFSAPVAGKLAAEPVERIEEKYLGNGWHRIAA